MSSLGIHFRFSVFGYCCSLCLSNLTEIIFDSVVALYPLHPTIAKRKNRDLRSYN